MRGCIEDHHQYEVLASNSTTTAPAISQNSASLLFIISVIISIVGICLFFECIKRYLKSKRLSNDAIISAEVRNISESRCLSADAVEDSIDPSIADAVRADQMPVSEVVISIDERDSEAVTRMRLDAALPLYQRWELAPSEENQVNVVQATVVHEEI